MMILGFEVGPLILSVAATVIGGLVLAWMQPKVKIIWSEPFQFNYLIRPPGNPPPPQITINTRTVFVQNSGRQSANGVEVILNWKPETHNLWPIIPHETEVMDDQRFVIRVHNLGHREWFRIEMLSASDLPQVVRVRSPEGEARQVDMGPMRIYSKWFNIGALVLMVIGLFAIIYHTIALTLPWL